MAKVKKVPSKFLYTGISLAACLILAIFLLLDSHTTTVSESKMSVQSQAITPAQVTSAIIDQLKVENMAQIQASQMQKHYDFPSGLVEDLSVNASTQSDSNTEISCFKLTNEKDYPQLQSVVAAHVSTKSAGLKDLNPDTYNAVKGYSLTQKKQYVLLVVGQNSDAAVKIFNDMIP